MNVINHMSIDTIAQLTYMKAISAAKWLTNDLYRKVDNCVTFEQFWKMFLINTY